MRRADNGGTEADGGGEKPLREEVRAGKVADGAS